MQPGDLWNARYIARSAPDFVSPREKAFGRGEANARTHSSQKDFFHSPNVFAFREPHST